MGKILQGGGRDTWTETLLKYQHLVPHYPGTTLIKPARVPPPPKLSGDVEADTLACLVAYESVCRHYYPTSGLRRRIRPARAADVTALATSSRNALVWGARLLYELGTQPHVWCAWSVRGWATHGPMRWRRVRPTMGWVYAKKRLAEQNTIFVWKSGGVESGARLRFARAHKELIKKWEAMRAALMLEATRSGLTEEKVKSIVAVKLSDREFSRLARAAQMETDERQAEIDQALVDGDYLWG